MLDVGELGPLFVEHVDRRFSPGAHADAIAPAARGLILEDAQCRKAGRRGGAHQPSAFAMRARLGGGFEHTRAQPLAAHFHQPEAGNPADLDSRAVVLQRFLHRFLDPPDVARLLHVDEVDDDEARHVAQPELPRDLLRRLQIRVVRCLLDVVLAGRAARVDVDGDQRLGRVDHQIAAGLQLHERLVHGRKLVLDAVALEQRRRLAMEFHPPHVAWHQQLHEAARGFVAFLALDDHFVDLAVIQIADRPFDEVAVAVDQRRRSARQSPLADLIPQPREVIEVALDLDLGALQPGGADDEAHGRGQV